MRNNIFLILSVILLGINIYQLDFQNPLSGDSKIAVIGVLGCLVAIVLILILIKSQKIDEKLKNKD
jgi:FtsH-binding integral membrane protein